MTESTCRTRARVNQLFLSVCLCTVLWISVVSLIATTPINSFLGRTRDCLISSICLCTLMFNHLYLSVHLPLWIYIISHHISIVSLIAAALTHLYTSTKAIYCDRSTLLPPRKCAVYLCACACVFFFVVARSLSISSFPSLLAGGRGGRGAGLT